MNNSFVYLLVIGISLYLGLHQEKIFGPALSALKGRIESSDEGLQLSHIPEELEDCRGPIFYTEPECIDRCVQSALDTLITEKQRKKIERSISCHSCPNDLRDDTLFGFIERVHQKHLASRREEFQGEATNLRIEIKDDEDKTRLSGDHAENEEDDADPDDASEPTPVKGHSWGSVLDAGTGKYSFKWLQRLPTNRIVGVTASESMKSSMMKSIKLRPEDELLVGQWSDSGFADNLYEQRFDVVLADYLVGAMEGFTPYEQDKIFGTLRQFVADKLYVVGQEPYGVLSDPVQGYAKRENRTGEELAREIAMNIMKLRDSVIMLVGERFYREYPVEWVVRNLRNNNFEVNKVRLFPINWGKKALEKQLNLCETKLKYAKKNIMITKSASASLIDEMQHQVKELRKLLDASAVINEFGVCFGMDYVIVASLY